MKILIGKYFEIVYTMDVTKLIGNFQAMVQAQNKIINSVRRDFGANFDLRMLEISIMDQKPKAVSVSNKKAKVNKKAKKK